MFKWLNKQGVESDSGFEVQRTGRFTCEYREHNFCIELEVESGIIGETPCISISRDAFSKWQGVRVGNESEAEQQARLRSNFRDAMEFQGLAVQII